MGKFEYRAMDLIYINPSEECRKAIEKIGGEIKDASDEIHEERVAIYYPIKKEIEYNDILKRFDLTMYSLTKRKSN